MRWRGLEAVCLSGPLNEARKETLLGQRIKGTLCSSEQVGPRQDPSRLIKDNLLPAPVASPLHVKRGWLSGVWRILKTLS